MKLSYETELQKAMNEIAVCKELVRKNKLKIIPDFNEIMLRELVAVEDNLEIVHHYHAAARCLRAGLELCVKNLYFAKFGSPASVIQGDSFSDRYKLSGISASEGPISRLVPDILSRNLFGCFIESYALLCSRVHYRTIYAHMWKDPRIQKFLKTESVDEPYVLSLGNSARSKMIKTVLIRHELRYALETLEQLLSKTELLGREKNLVKQ